MSYTYVSARYANSDGTAVIAVTREFGAVALSQVDRPSEWAALQASGITIQPYVPPVVQKVYSFLQFIELFTDAEQIELVGASMTDAPTKLWYDRAVGANYIALSDPRLTAGLQAMVDSGVITAQRRDRVLQGLPPE